MIDIVTYLVDVHLTKCSRMTWFGQTCNLILRMISKEVSKNYTANETATIHSYIKQIGYVQLEIHCSVFQ